MKTNSQEIRNLRIEQIRILNPRFRDEKKFSQIANNIKTIGLKRPITVRLITGGKEGEEKYEVVCGQGRYEAYKAAGATHIPAIIQNYGRREALMAGLVENIARRNVRAIDQITSIRWMHNQGNSAAIIARKTGYQTGYIDAILVLLERGEERLLDAAILGHIPITVATQIAQTSDKDVQKIVMEAYERGEIKKRGLNAFRRFIQMRDTWGKDYSKKAAPQSVKKTSAQDFVAHFRQLSEKRRAFIKKAGTVEKRLFAISAAFQTLTGDENFLNVLRAEKMNTMPQRLKDIMEKEI